MLVSYIGAQNQISEAYGGRSILLIVAILCIISIVTFSRLFHGDSKDDNAPMSMEAALLFRGIAIILLVLGHFCIKCVAGIQLFEYAGEWAVAVFLLLSGSGLAKRYDLETPGADFISFMRARIKKLVIPVWTTLALFYLLDYLLAGRTHSPAKIVLSFFGIINADPPNGPDWFISYILFLYIVFAGVTRLRISKWIKCLILLACLYATSLAIRSLSSLAYFKMWPRYSAVFPLALVIGAYRRTLMTGFERILKRFPVIGLALLMGVFALYIKKVGMGFILEMLPGEQYAWVVDSIRLIYFVIFTFLSISLVETWNINSRFIQLLGKYSLEIFLLHMPFMVYYDLLLYRRPLVIFFFVYSGLIVLASMLLKKWTDFVSLRLLA